jgi:hypothetical protein
MMAFLGKAWRWLKDNAVAVLLTIIAVLGAGWLWKVEHDKQQSLRSQMKVERTRTKIAKLAGQRAVLEEKEEGYAEQAAELDQQIVEAKSEAVSARESVDGRSMDALDATIALAQDSTPAEQDPPTVIELPPTQAVPLELRGALGLWMPEEMSRQVQADVEELQHLRVVVERQEGRLELEAERVRNLHEINKLAIQERTFAVEALEAAVSARQEAEDALDAWYRSPVLWAAVGLVLGAAIMRIAAELIPDKTVEVITIEGM